VTLRTAFLNLLNSIYLLLDVSYTVFLRLIDWRGADEENEEGRNLEKA
jgi:hypothetical protein